MKLMNSVDVLIFSKTRSSPARLELTNRAYIWNLGNLNNILFVYKTCVSQKKILLEKKNNLNYKFDQNITNFWYLLHSLLFLDSFR